MSRLLGIKAFQLVIAFFGPPTNILVLQRKTATCRLPCQMVCSAPLKRITPKVVTDGWQKTLLVYGPGAGLLATGCQGLTAVLIKGGHPATRLPSWTSWPHNLLAEQNLGTLLWKELQEGMVRLFNFVLQN